MNAANVGVICSTSPILGSTAASAPSSSTSSSPIKSKKRRHVPFSNHVAIPVKKRSKLMGRPKNNWTPARKRKLVRLYLMTELGVEEIADVLQAKGFQPWAQVKLLRDYKSARALEKMQPDAECVPEMGHSIASFIISPSCWTSYTMPSPGQDLHDAKYPPFEVNCGSSFTVHESVSGFDDKTPDSKDKGIEVTGVGKDSMLLMDVDNQIPNTQNGIPHQQAPLDDPILKNSISISGSKTTSHVDGGKEIDVPDDYSTVSGGGKSTRSILSISSLRRRLHSKYSNSLLGDIQSLMGRLSVSSCSDVSSFRSHKPIRQPRLQVCTSIIPCHYFVLPGIFPQYCWDNICQNRLLCCDDIKLPCNRAPLFRLSGTGTHQLELAEILLSIRTQTVRAEDLNVVDSFGNSILHIVAALGSPPSHLLYLILSGSNVHRLNSANQTFLHVMDVSDVAHIGEFRDLLEELARSNFNFTQQDHNGQTAMHALTQEVNPWKVLNSMFHCMSVHHIPFPRCRDSLGKSIARHLNERGFNLSPTTAQDDPAVADLPRLQLVSHCESQTSHAWQPSLAKYQASDLIQDMVHLNEYEVHADLLRTILRSGDDALFEDIRGRNGLHCLAEVRLDLPLAVSSAEPTEKLRIQRENYMDQLLSNGVCPNSYDEQGLTPFMSFIIHTRVEDDFSTTRLLSKLWEAGANINNRTSQGETPLHLSVKLGRRAATKFLLSHGANIHARNNKGLGILALGLQSSNRAAEDAVLYAQISLCICLVGSAGAVPAPTLLDEWVSPEFRGHVRCTPSSSLPLDHHAMDAAFEDTGFRKSRIVLEKNFFWNK
ncbi:hypothetical protein BKA65DRAFT_540230 [Rhexocercosporidium sp. MPI-PUGE-AT-0058]|nr:hypothetical protein BKA65DRAFT_540230 [Rhexocercosporidium sp. MPI-PUGE-AT-0058]